jgi:hypothetical protein
MRLGWVTRGACYGWQQLQQQQQQQQRQQQQQQQQQIKCFT